MNIVEATGSLCLGIVVGWLVRFFIRRFKSPLLLPSIIIFLGGNVVTIVGNELNLLWFYSIGIFLGLVIYTLLAHIYLRYKKTR